ncbi:MAG: hypothetical protein BGN96_14820 [Bacteroidales bacterium 45-6]|nr:MAG: hypothetical protein BGN96_14820 [Bacteroidales bacterium 45-6]
MNEISFEIQDEKITWLHSDDSQSAFFGEGYNLSSTNNADTIYFFNDTKTSYQFSYSNDIYSTQLSGQIIIK